MNIDDQKVQVADEIKRDIWKYLVSSDVIDDAWYYMCYISFCAKWIPGYSFYMPGFWPDTNRHEQLATVAGVYKPDICKSLVSSDVADDAWYNYACYISSCAK